MIKLDDLKESLLFINKEIVKIANDNITPHIIKTALLGVNKSLATIIREIKE